MKTVLETFLPFADLSAFEAELAAADTPAACLALAPRLVELVRRSWRPEGEGRQATRLISLLNDRYSRQLVAVTAAGHRLPEVEWCWLALGSEGRHEQTLLTDQDNALIFAASDAREADVLRSLFLPFAQELNQHLAAAGFSLCPGGIMAGNPAYCLSCDEWAERFIDWVRRPEPQALLNASIFFDLRPLFGQLELGERLRRLLLNLTSDTPAFLHLMASNALAAEVPLGFRGEIKLDAQACVDLKKFGSRIFVDAARIFALAAACPAVSSDERLAQAGPGNGLTAEEIASANAAFSHILRLRLAQQHAAELAGMPMAYSVAPAALHDVDRLILRESLHQARRLQQRLRLNYSL